MSDALPENPLVPCPDTPNCVRETRLFDFPADTLFARARTTLDAIGAATVQAHPEGRRLEAVFKVFFFKDDVTLAVEPHDGGSALHIRSASRVGQSDLGVNRRRVNRFFETLDEAF